MCLCGTLVFLVLLTDLSDKRRKKISERNLLSIFVAMMMVEW